LEFENLLVPALELKLVVVLLLYKELGQVSAALALVIPHDQISLLAFLLQGAQLLLGMLGLGI